MKLFFLFAPRLFSSSEDSVRKESDIYKQEGLVFTISLNVNVIA